MSAGEFALDETREVCFLERDPKEKLLHLGLVLAVDYITYDKAACTYSDSCSFYRIKNIA